MSLEDMISVREVTGNGRTIYSDSVEGEGTEGRVVVRIRKIGQ